MVGYEEDVDEAKKGAVAPIAVSGAAFVGNSSSSSVAGTPTRRYVQQTAA